MTPRHRGARAAQRGFVLIGVVIFVLALTIIGLSLYSLSGYEAQFLQRSVDTEQAFHTAVGGIERARFVLTLLKAPPVRLEDVKQDLPPGVLSTVAIQTKSGGVDSTGPVDWTITEPVLIRVTAGRAGERTLVEGTFLPILTQNYYTQLLTVSGGIEIVTGSTTPPHPRDQKVWLDGTVWESSAQDTSLWLDHLRPPVPVGIRKSPAVPVPDVAPFLTQHPGPIDGAALAVQSGTPTEPIYTLDASMPPGVPGYFRAEDSDPDFSFNSWPLAGCTIQVRGLAVWLLPRGALFWQGTEIQGDPTTDCLVLIAGQKTGSGFSDLGPTASICFTGSLQAHIPVILVSSGKVLLKHGNDPIRNSTTNDLAIFARSAEFMGPGDEPGVAHSADLHRVPGGPLDALFLDVLASQSALPNATSATGRRLDLVPGSWQANVR